MTDPEADTLAASRLQERLGTTAQAGRFYAEQVTDHLNPRMREFIARMDMMFIATADRRGVCASSFRAGPAGFVQVVDERRLRWPEYRGNGVMTSLGNIVDNPSVGLLFMDFFRDTIGLHVNGRAAIVDADDVPDGDRDPADDPVPGRRPVQWVTVDVDEAYIHCSKHIPRLTRAAPDGEGRGRVNRADYFAVRAGRMVPAPARTAQPARRWSLRRLLGMPPAAR